MSRQDFGLATTFYSDQETPDFPEGYKPPGELNFQDNSDEEEATPKMTMLRG